MTEDEQSEAIARIDANVKMLLGEHSQCKAEISQHGERGYNLLEVK